MFDRSTFPVVVGPNVVAKLVYMRQVHQAMHVHDGVCVGPERCPRDCHDVADSSNKSMRGEKRKQLVSHVRSDG